MLFKPDIALETIIIIFWIESIISWIAWVVMAIQDKEFEDRWILAGLSIFQILLWVWLAAYPKVWEEILKIFIVLIWILIVIKWILLLIQSFSLKKAWFSKWYWTLITGCCLILLGAFLSLNSLLAILFVNILIGLWMFVTGISMIVWALQIKKAFR